MVRFITYKVKTVFIYKKKIYIYIFGDFYQVESMPKKKRIFNTSVHKNSWEIITFTIDFHCSIGYML